MKCETSHVAGNLEDKTLLKVLFSKLIMFEQSCVCYMRVLVRFLKKSHVLVLGSVEKEGFSKSQFVKTGCFGMLVCKKYSESY